MTRPNRLPTVFTILALVAGCYSPPKLPEGQAAFLRTDVADVGPFHGVLLVIAIDGLCIFNLPEPIMLAPGKHKVGLEWSELREKSFGDDAPYYPGMLRLPSTPTFEAKATVAFVAEAGRTYIAKVTEAKVLSFGREKAGVRFWIEPEVP